MQAPYYRHWLALAHHRGFAGHADLCAPGVLELIRALPNPAPTVLELGCGSGALTRHLVEAGLEVIATDASPAMVDLARKTVPDAAEHRLITLPDDPIPKADVIVSVGHVLNYLPDVEAVRRALSRLANALKPGGLLAMDVLDLEYGRINHAPNSVGSAGDDWAVISRSRFEPPDRLVREITGFVLDNDTGWQRDDEVHENVLVDTAALAGDFDPDLYDNWVRRSFGRERLPQGMRVLLVRSRPR
ncbi:MAG: class I SAM-dependent methyltransferase [Acidimicrobiia bacterium]